jgi:hypothetical protein
MIRSLIGHPVDLLLAPQLLMLMIRAIEAITANTSFFIGLV